MYKKALQLGLRFQSTRGPLTIEQLMTLQPEELDSLAVQLDEAYANSKGKSFIQKRNTKDASIKLQLDIVLDILQDKLIEREEAAQAKQTKEERQRILEIIKKKEDEQLENLSLEELKKKLK